MRWCVYRRVPSFEYWGEFLKIVRIYLDSLRIAPGVDCTRFIATTSVCWGRPSSTKLFSFCSVILLVFNCSHSQFVYVEVSFDAYVCMNLFVYLFSANFISYHYCIYNVFNTHFNSPTHPHTYTYTRPTFKL